MATYELGRKQTSSQEDWLRVRAAIEDHVSRAESDALVDKTITRIRKVIRSGAGFGYAWSGGKDSQVLRFLLAEAGYQLPSTLCLCNLEYPAFERWWKRNQPDGLKMYRVDWDLEWLAKNPHMLFPKSSAVSMKWFHPMQHAHEDIFLREHKLHTIILGRRLIEGNYVGKDGLYTTSWGLTRFNPLKDWKHEDILGVMHYRKLAYAPYYGWPRGFRVGSGPWAKRRAPAGENDLYLWRELLQIDRTIVEGAARYFKDAARILSD